MVKHNLIINNAASVFNMFLICVKRKLQLPTDPLICITWVNPPTSVGTWPGNIKKLLALFAVPGQKSFMFSVESAGATLLI